MPPLRTHPKLVLAAAGALVLGGAYLHRCGAQRGGDRLGDQTRFCSTIRILLLNRDISFLSMRIQSLRGAHPAPRCMLFSRSAAGGGRGVCAWQAARPRPWHAQRHPDAPPPAAPRSPHRRMTCAASLARAEALQAGVRVNKHQPAPVVASLLDKLFSRQVGWGAGMGDCGACGAACWGLLGRACLLACRFACLPACLAG